MVCNCKTCVDCINNCDCNPTCSIQLFQCWGRNSVPGYANACLAPCPRASTDNEWRCRFMMIEVLLHVALIGRLGSNMPADIFLGPMGNRTP